MVPGRFDSKLNARKSVGPTRDIEIGRRGWSRAVSRSVRADRLIKHDVIPEVLRRPAGNANYARFAFRGCSPLADATH